MWGLRFRAYRFGVERPVKRCVTSTCVVHLGARIRSPGHQILSLQRTWKARPNVGFLSRVPWRFWGDIKEGHMRSNSATRRRKDFFSSGSSGCLGLKHKQA